MSGRFTLKPVAVRAWTFLGSGYLPDFSDKSWRAPLTAAIEIKRYFPHLVKLRRKITAVCRI
jgi:hypothetical protein